MHRTLPVVMLEASGDRALRNLERAALSGAPEDVARYAAEKLRRGQITLRETLDEIARVMHDEFRDFLNDKLPYGRGYMLGSETYTKVLDQIQQMLKFMDGEQGLPSAKQVEKLILNLKKLDKVEEPATKRADSHYWKPGGRWSRQHGADLLRKLVARLEDEL